MDGDPRATTGTVEPLVRRARIRAALWFALAAAGAASAAPDARAGGGWVPARGHSYFEVSTRLLDTDRRYDAAGARAPFVRLVGVNRPTRYRDAGLGIFGEIGLGAGFGVEGDVSAREVRVQEPAASFTTRGLADARVQLKRGFRAGAVAWALSIETRFPLGYAAADAPSLGSGAADVAANLHLGSGAAWGYAQAEIGARARGGAPGDEWPWAAQVGVQASPRLTLVADARGHGLFEPPAVGTTFDPLRASSSVAMVGPGLAWTPRPGWRIAAQGWRSLAGRNTPEGWQWKLAVARAR